MQIDIIYKSLNWERAVSESKIREIVLNAINHTSLIKNAVDVDVAIVLADSEFAKELNSSYRRKDRATNVLSFPNYNILKNGIPEVESEISLGDIVISFSEVFREAKEQEKEFQNHFHHLLVHGVLHILGYDHRNDKDAEIMEGLEIEILKNLEISNPYV